MINQLFRPVRKGLLRDLQIAEYDDEFEDDYPPQEGWLTGPDFTGPPAPYSPKGATLAAAMLARLPGLDLAELEGRLLARQPFRAIAKQFGVHRRAVRTFRARWFDIDGRTTFDLLMNAVPGPDTCRSRIPHILSGCLANDAGVQIRYYALMGGLRVMEQVLEVIRNPEREFDLATLAGVQAARARFRTQVCLAVRSIDFGNPVITNKANVFDRLLRQASVPRSKPIWTPLRFLVSPVLQQAPDALASFLDEWELRLAPTPASIPIDKEPKSKKRKQPNGPASSASRIRLRPSDRLAADEPATRR